MRTCCLLLLALIALPHVAHAGDDEPATDGESPPAEEAPADPAPADDPPAEAPPPIVEEVPPTVEEVPPTVEEVPSPEPPPAPAAEAPACAHCAHQGPAGPPPPPKPLFSAMVQERARVEFVSNKDFAGPPDGRMKIGNRIRAGLGMTLGPVRVFAQVQDVRTWGSEVNPANGGEGTLFDYSANNLDMHQGYGEVISPFGPSFRLGRQEIDWHGQRLIGAVAWTDQARSFDAARLVYSGDNAGAEVFYALMLDRPTSATDTALVLEDQHLVAVRGGPRIGDALLLDGVAILRIDNLAGERLATVGAYATGKAGPFAYEAEGYFQGGARGASSIAAFLVGVRAGATLHKDAGLYIGGGVDLVSGDSDPTDTLVGTFDTLYGTNHKFYGHFDRYLNLPVHTGGAGLVDGLFRVKVAPGGKVVVSNDLHVFGAMNPAAGADGFHGVEWDVDLTVKIVKGLSAGAGLWTYFPGGWYGAGATPEFGSYAMANFLLN